MFLCTRMKELHRVFEYHGAEHKTIACYEAGLPLTVENIRKQSRFHPRCGTSFMILVIIISIFLYAVLPWTSTGLRIVYKLCTLGRPLPQRAVPYRIPAGAVDAEVDDF